VRQRRMRTTAAQDLGVPAISGAGISLQVISDPPRTARRIWGHSTWVAGGGTSRWQAADEKPARYPS
jgi:hypothetical protein